MRKIISRSFTMNSLESLAGEAQAAMPCGAAAQIVIAAPWNTARIQCQNA
jgi:hypothetical protein